MSRLRYVKLLLSQESGPVVDFGKSASYIFFSRIVLILRFIIIKGYFSGLVFPAGYEQHECGEA